MEECYLEVMGNKLIKLASLVAVIVIPFVTNGASLIDIYEDALINDPRLKEAYALSLIHI